MVNEMTSSPILFMSSAHVERMRPPTISGCLTISSTVSWPIMPRRWPSMTSRMRPSRSAGGLVRNCSDAVRIDSGSDFTLIWATASTVTATPWLVYKSCLGATSNDISSSDSPRQFSTIGKITVPRPLTTRVPRKPYTIRASCGPALRNSLANTPMSIRITRSDNRPMTTAGCSIYPLWPGARPLLELRLLELRFEGVLPRPHVRDPLLVPRNHHLGAARDGIAVLAAGAGDAARALLRVNQLAGAAGADSDAQFPEHADHVIIGRIERRFVRQQHPRQEPEHDGRAADAADGRHRERQQEPDRVIVLEQIAGAAEPGQERRDGPEIEPRQFPAPRPAARHALRGQVPV